MSTKISQRRKLELSRGHFLKRFISLQTKLNEFNYELNYEFNLERDFLITIVTFSCKLNSGISAHYLNSGDQIVLINYKIIPTFIY